MGTYKGTDYKSASYTLSMGYDNMHRITSKKQHLSQTGVQFEGTFNAGYELTYTYQKADGKKFQLDNVRDINYRTEDRFESSRIAIPPITMPVDALRVVNKNPIYRPR